MPSTKVTSDSSRQNLKLLTPEKRLEILNYCKDHSVKGGAEEFGIKTATIYYWQKKFNTEGIDGLNDSRRNNKGAKPIPEWKRKKILTVKESDPGFGASQIRNQLRREGTTVSIETIRKVLSESGYAIDKRKAPKKDYIRFEATRPLELAQTDICEFYIHKQKVYLVLLLDDYSRFLLGFALLEQCNMEQIEKMVKTAINRYGKMERILSDRGFVFHGWRGINAFEKFLEDQDIYHIHTSPYHPQTIGKIEAANKNIQKELIRTKEFSSVSQAREKIERWVWRYNYHRVHQGLDGICVPADRFHGWLEQVENSMSKLIEEGIDISLRKINLFNISLNNGNIELTIFGRKAYLSEKASLAESQK
jgi:transposase InsO family protein